MYNRQPYDLDTRLKIVLSYRTKNILLKIFAVFMVYLWRL